MSRLGVCGPSVSLFPIQRPSSIWRLRRKATPRCSAEARDDEVDYKVLTSVTSNYNNIVILDTPDSRVLLLDSSNNVHSILHKGKKWTDAYWDEFATLPAIVPKGPVAIFGLGGATAAHLMLELWPSLRLVGWEIDEILIGKAREYLGLSDLEKHTEGGGVLEVHIGDVLSPSVTIPGGYAGIIVDLFSDGKVLPQLEEVTTWLEMNKMLMPNGRLMVNCGAATKELSNTSFDVWELNATIIALCKAFPEQVGDEGLSETTSLPHKGRGKVCVHPQTHCVGLQWVSWKKLPKRAGENYLALTGPLPDLSIWSARLPDQLSSSVKEWRSCTPS